MGEIPVISQSDREEVYADLGGIPEVAQALGVSFFRVKRWIERRATTNCPRPVMVLRNGYLYSINDWKGWFALWRVTRGSETWKNRKRATRPDD